LLVTNRSTSQLGAKFCLILPYQTAGKSESEIVGGAGHSPSIITFLKELIPCTFVEYSKQYT